jgi:hypothetical protein
MAEGGLPEIGIREKTVMFNEERSIHLHVVQMTDSFYAWAGDDDGTMDSLSVAIQTRFDQMPSARELLEGGKDNGTGRGMATRLSKRLRSPVFLSINFAQLDDELALFVERQLLTLISDVA